MRNMRTAAMLAIAAGLTGGFGLPVLEVRRQPNDGPVWVPTREPDNRGRRAVKDATRLVKAEEKRKRRAAKRLAEV